MVDDAHECIEANLALADAGAVSAVSAISRTDHENNPVVDRFLSVARAG